MSEYEERCVDAYMCGYYETMAYYGIYLEPSGGW